MLKYSELIKTLIIEPIKIADDFIHFKVDIFKCSDKGYFAQISRLENYQLKPSFNNEDLLANEAFYVLDNHSILSLGNKYHSTLDECLNYTIDQISKRFLVKNL